MTTLTSATTLKSPSAPHRSDTVATAGPVAFGSLLLRLSLSVMLIGDGAYALRRSKHLTMA